jgi:uncharacterized protein (TIGR02186 family)
MTVPDCHRRHRLLMATMSIIVSMAVCAERASGSPISPAVKGAGQVVVTPSVIHEARRSQEPVPLPTRPPTAQEREPATPPPADAAQRSPAPPALPPPAEGIEVDVSTRTVAITSVFTGTEIVVFGSVDNSRQQSAESGYYDIVVVVEGAAAPAVVREKRRMSGVGIWVNATRMRFELPLYRAIASTKPIDEIAEPRELLVNGISFDKIFAGLNPGKPGLDAFKGAVMRLKQRDGLYVTQDFGGAFIGRSLFRAGVKLPGNIPIGPLEVWVHLFKDGKVLASKSANVRLERQGLERLIYDFAYEYPIWYGFLAVAMAAGAGLVASAVFQRPSG